MKALFDSKWCLREKPVEGVQRFVPSTVDLQWVSRQLQPDGTPAQIRNPEGEAVTYQKILGFSAAGRRYPSLSTLQVKQCGDTDLYQDIYGRQVLHLSERFPCFDSYDYLNEDRYYHWFYLLTDGKLTEVYYADTYREIQVTEDVRKIRVKHWDAIRKAWNIL